MLCACSLNLVSICACSKRLHSIISVLVRRQMALIGDNYLPGIIAVVIFITIFISAATCWYKFDVSVQRKIWNEFFIARSQRHPAHFYLIEFRFGCPTANYDYKHSHINLGNGPFMKKIQNFSAYLNYLTN